MSLQDSPVSEKAAIQAVVSQSRLAQQQWGRTSLQQRAAVLHAIAKQLQHTANELAAIVNAETHKPVADALSSDVAIAAGSFRQAVELGLQCLRPQGYSLAQSWRALALGRTHQTHYTPKGVVAAITPWNYPLGIPAWALAASLMTGNACILKPSELSPRSGLLLVEIIQDVLEKQGHSKELVQCLTGDGNTGKALLNEAIDYVLFTGSVATGRAIQAQLSERNIGVSLELGGSCPAIVLRSLPNSAWDSVISQITWGRCFNAGQSCAAVKRLLLPEAWQADWLKRLQEKFENIPEPLVLINETQRQRLHQQVVQALVEGATLVCGGVLDEAQGDPVYPPTILANLPSQSALWQEEWFGPVLLVDAYANDAEAITKANGTPFGLTASVFGLPAEAEPIAGKLQAGLVTINDVALAHYGFLHIPWQGVKNSGPGVSHAAQGLLGLVQSKTIGANHIPLTIKPPWLLGKSPSSKDSGFQHGLVRWLSSSFAVAQWNPQLLKGLWQRRPSTRL